MERKVEPSVFEIGPVRVNNHFYKDGGGRGEVYYFQGFSGSLSREGYRVNEIPLYDLDSFPKGDFQRGYIVTTFDSIHSNGEVIMGTSSEEVLDKLREVVERQRLRDIKYWNSERTTKLLLRPE